MRELKRLTINLEARVEVELTAVAELTGSDRTTAINRAIRLYAAVMNRQEQGFEVVFRKGDTEQVLYLL